MRLSSFLRLSMIAVLFAVVSMFGSETADAQCPNRGPGYWDSIKTVTTPVLMDSCAGVYCLVDFTYCYHISTGPGDDPEYYIASYTIHPLQCPCAQDPYHVLKGIRTWCYFQKECELWCRNKGDIRTVKVSHARCYKALTTNPDHWIACEGTGECNVVYTMRCDEDACVWLNEVATSTGFGCLHGPEGCAPACQ